MVGYLPEVVPVYGELTVKEFLRFVAELNGWKGKRSASPSTASWKRPACRASTAA